MDYDGRFIMQKTVDWSLLNDGMTIPVSSCALLKAWDESILTHGVGKDIKAASKREQSKACFQNAEREQARPKVKVLIDGESYGYRDEISGEKIGDSVVEAHHIDYFTRSQNNDSTNIIIISPNYHRIIHKNNPHFNRKKFQFEFRNGEVLRLKLYEHLK
jgi:hypothetical protein